MDRKKLIQKYLGIIINRNARLYFSELKKEYCGYFDDIESFKSINELFTYCVNEEYKYACELSEEELLDRIGNIKI